MADRVPDRGDDVGPRELAAAVTCAIALFVSVSLIFYAQLAWLAVFGALGAYDPSWLPVRAILVVVPAGTVAVVPGVVAALVLETVPARTAWLASTGVLAVTLGLHDLLYGPIYLVG